MSSCHLQHLANIGNLSTIFKYLFNEPEAVTDEQEDERWDEEEWSKNWDFSDNVENNTTAPDSEARSDEADWIQYCCVAFSPAGDFLCLAHNDKAVFLTGESRNINSAETGDLDISFKGVLTEDEGETITDVLCLPLISHKRTSHGSRDWTCVLVGFSTGYVRMYSESGSVLIAELLHESPVVQLNCRSLDTTPHTSYNASAEHHNELTILYRDSLVAIEGFSLFHTLRACRSQLAVATARGNTAIDPPPLSYKKWILRGQEEITAHASAGIITLPPFDQMHAYSLIDGFGADIKSSATAMSQYVVAGTGPFIGFYYAMEGSTQPFLSHVALAVASKLKSALYNAASGWFSWRQNPQVDDINKAKAKQKVEVGTPLGIRSGLPDIHRHANSIVLAPGANWLAATSDSFGRVMLLDLVKARALRMWKGYRDAQVGFVRTSDDNHTVKSHSKVKRTALFLVIYAPRRGILEIWSCINGPRVGTFNIGKNSRLLYPGFGMLGAHSRMDNAVADAYTVQCCILEINGLLRDISIPFHLALSDSNSNKARDIHLLKKVAQLLQAPSKDGDEIMKLMLEMQLPSVRKQAVEKLMVTSNLGCKMLKTCLLKIQEQLSIGDPKKEEKELLHFLNAHVSLLDLFSSFKKLNSTPDDRTENVEKDIKVADVSRELMTSRDEAESIIKLITEYGNTIAPSKSKESNLTEVADFLKCFTVNPSDHFQHKISNSKAKTNVLGNYLLRSSLFGNVSPTEVVDTIQAMIKLPNSDITNLVFENWKNNEKLILQDFVKNVKRLMKFLELLCRRKDETSTEEEEDEQMVRWRRWIRTDVCVPSTNILSSYVIALTARAVDVALRTNQSISDSVENLENKGEPPTYEETVHGEIPSPDRNNLGWETLRPELESWNSLIKQLEDCLSINIALYKANCDIASQEKENDIQRVSVYDLLHNGPGYIPELVADRICTLKVEPGLVLQKPPEGDTEHSEPKTNDKDSFVDYLRNELVDRFPRLLSSNSVHAHCFWQEMVLWNKDPEDIVHMVNSITHVRLLSCDPYVQHGLVLMAWRTFVSKRFSSLAKLVNKVGKAPKDRLCRKEVGISSIVMSKFCHCCTQLLQTIADADPDQFPKPQLELEEVYGKRSSLIMADDTWQDVVGKESIMDMGRDQPTANYALVQHSMHLSFVLDGIMEFTLRGVKPLTHLFDVNGRNFFFLDLTSTRISFSSRIDTDITNHRTKFLANLVTAAVNKMSLEESNEDMKENMNEWIETSVHMAAEFQLDDSLIRIRYICELFKHGLDSIGNEVLKTTGNAELLASQLIVIVGQRLSHILLNTSPEDGVIILSQMSPTLSAWIKAQNPQELDVLEVPAKDTLFLAREILSLMSETHEQYSLCEFLVEALSVIVNS